MKLIVGLGNPGYIYANSRHNIGFRVVKALAKELKATFKKDKSSFSLSARAKTAKHNVVLALPLTFMNLSGSAVKGLLKKYRIDLKDLLVVCDDLDLECGRLKLRPGGSSGGHRGLESIIASFASRDFARLRLGIGRPLRGKDATDYVLSAFSRKEKEEVSSMIERATVCCSSWLTKGTTETMNIFNSRSTKNE